MSAVSNIVDRAILNCGAAGRHANAAVVATIPASTSRDAGAKAAVVGS
jgi:hypothetical protein